MVLGVTSMDLDRVVQLGKEPRRRMWWISMTRQRAGRVAPERGGERRGGIGGKMNPFFGFVTPRMSYPLR